MVGKVIGSAFVVAATSKIGYDKANDFEKRVRDLKEFQSALWLLKSEIDFNMPLLKDALLVCSKLVHKNVGDVFAKASENLNNGLDTISAWCDAVDNTKLYLYKEDILVVKEFANSLGVSDIKLQIENIENTVTKLKAKEENAVDNLKKYSKMCKTLGVTAGLLIVTLLL